MRKTLYIASLLLLSASAMAGGEDQHPFKPSGGSSATAGAAAGAIGVGVGVGQGGGGGAGGAGGAGGLGGQGGVGNGGSGVGNGGSGVGTMNGGTTRAWGLGLGGAPSPSASNASGCVVVGNKLRGYTVYVEGDPVFASEEICVLMSAADAMEAACQNLNAANIRLDVIEKLRPSLKGKLSVPDGEKNLTAEQCRIAKAPPAPAPVPIPGPKGDNGDKGDPGIDGAPAACAAPPAGKRKVGGASAWECKRKAPK